MVKIPDRPYAYLAGNLPDARYAGIDNGAARNIAALADGAQKLFGVALHIQEQRDHDLLVEAQNRYSKSMTDFSLSAEQTRLGDAARGYSKDFDGTSDSTQADVAAWLKENGGSANAEQAFGQWAVGRKTAGSVGAARFEHGQLLAHSQDLFAARVQSISSQLEHDPLSFADASAQLEQAFVLGVGQGLFRPEEARVKLKDAQDKLGLTAFDSLYAMDRGVAMKSMATFGLPSAAQARARKRYRADVRADAAIARAERAQKSGMLLEGLEDAETLATYSGDASAMDAIGKGLVALGDKRGDTILRKAEMYREHKALTTESANIPLPELASSIKADMGVMAGATGQSDPAALRKSAFSLELRQNMYTRRLAALKTDPAGTVQERAAKVAGEAATPETLVTARLQVQAADGIIGPLQKVLTASEREGFSNAWSSGGAQERLAMFQQIQAGYGKHAGRVMGEIGMNPLEQSMAHTALNAQSMESAEAFTRLSAAAGVADSELPKLPRAEALRDEVISESKRLSAMRDMMIRVMPGNSSFAGAVKASEDVVTRMLRMNGGNTEAVISMLDSGIGRLEDDNFALLFETGVVDEDTLEDGLTTFARNNLAAFDEALPGYADGQKKEERTRYLQRKGIWANAPDGDGFVLFDPQSQAPVINKQGQYFRMRAGDAKQYAAVAAEERAEAAQDAISDTYWGY